MAPTALSAAAFASWVIQEGGLPEEKVLAAVARQVVYGGSLDTALLESGVSSVEELWALLSRATGLAIPPVSLVAPRTWDQLPMPPEASDRCRAVPAGLREDGVLQLLCAEPVAWDELQGLSTKLGKTFELFIAPEVHVEALRSALFARPMSARLAKLWMRLVGRSGLRTRPVARKPSEVAPGALPGIFGDAEVTLPGGEARGAEVVSSEEGKSKGEGEGEGEGRDKGKGAEEAPQPETRAEAAPPAGAIAVDERRPRRSRPRHRKGSSENEAGTEGGLAVATSASAEHDPSGSAATPLLAVMALEDVTHPGWSHGDGALEEAAPDAATDEATENAQEQAGPATKQEEAQYEAQGEHAEAHVEAATTTSPPAATTSAPFAEPSVADSFDWQSDTTPEAPYALTLDFEAEPPLVDEPTDGDEARASAMAWETFSATEALCRRARDIADPGRTLALRALRRRLDMPPVPSFRRHLVALLDGGGPVESMRALADLTEMRDREAVPAIVPLLEASDKKLAAAARQALMLLTLEDFGHKLRKWQAWWNAHRSSPPTDWLFAGLSHKDASIRLAAAEELRQITGAYFGYHFDLPKRDREDAKRRWQSWWEAMAEHERDEAGG